MEPEGVDALAIEGYRPCVRCGTWCIDSDRKVMVCPDCASTLNDRATAARLAYEVAGRTYKTKERPQRKRKPVKLTEKAKADRKIRDRARSRAVERLILIYRPMFELLMDEEMIAAGAQPGSNRRTPRSVAIRQTLAADLEDAIEREAAAGERLSRGR